MCLFIGMVANAAETGARPPKSAAVMDFELINEMHGYETEESQKAQGNADQGQPLLLRLQIGRAHV